jgi:hypothetical protein
MLKHPHTQPLFLAALLSVGFLLFSAVQAEEARQRPAVPQPTLLDFGVVGDGKTDNSIAIQRAADAGIGQIFFAKGSYLLTKTIVVDLDRVGPTSFSSDGTATLIMSGEGPAIRFLGTHEGTAAPHTVKPNVWARQRAPMVDGLEIVGANRLADGIEAAGTMQLTVTRTTVRDVRHGIHLLKRNRNVVLSDCHIYNNTGIGVFLDGLNLHQINIANCHISYNGGGGVVARKSEIRNLQIGTCDIEGNMSPEGPATANILLDSTGSSIGEVAIVGCTIQHAHDAPESANIRVLGRSLARPITEERRHGNITIANNILSDVQFNLDIQAVRAATISGNTIWRGYDHNLRIVDSKNIVVSGNVFDRNPRYDGGDGATAKLAVSIRDSQDCIVTGNQLFGTGQIPVAMRLSGCRRIHVNVCSIFEYAKSGLLLQDCDGCRVTNCMIESSLESAKQGFDLRIEGGMGSWQTGNTP